MASSTVSRSLFDPRYATHRLRNVVEAVFFWLAVILPFLYVPSFVVGDLVPPVVVAVAIGLNVVAILLGHRHDPRSARR